jgi:uncharacterized membrane protein YeaQ/YmgE (transglycosylase-associated protein family)
MGVLVWVITGLVAGWLAGAILHGSGYGAVGDVILGVLGALVGGFLASAVFRIPDAAGGVNIPTTIVAFVGGIIVVMVIRAIARPTTI